MPIVTVSRQLGSRGDLIANLVAERLDLLLVDRGMFVSLLQERGLSLAEALSAETEEMPVDLWGRLAEQRRRSGLLLGAILYELAVDNRLLVVGHGAEVIFGGIGHALHIKVAAPFEARVARVAEHEAVSREAASELVRQSDHERFGYTRYLFHADWMESERYDLFVNTQSIDVPGAVALVARAATVAELAATPESLAALADRTLANRVNLTLLREPGVFSAGIEVSAERGAVTMRGFVRSAEQRALAEGVARGVEGVVVLRAELAVMGEGDG